MATAGARDASGNSLITANSGQAVDSICPKGWHLPEGGEHNMLISYRYELPVGTSNVSDARLLDSPFSRIRAGAYMVGGGDNRFEGQGLFGAAFTSEVIGASTAQTLLFNGSMVVFGASMPFSIPTSVRCVANH